MVERFLAKEEVAGSIPVARSKRSMAREIQKFDVGMKAFIGHHGKLLVVKEGHSGQWELPGGRIDVGEEQWPHIEILKREIREELGTNVKINILHPFSTWVRPFEKIRIGEFVFLVGWLCDFDAGEIELSPEHTEYRWVDEAECKVLPLVKAYVDPVRQYWEYRQRNT